MKKITIGIFFGVAAGTIDIILMIMQNLTWDVNISAFSMWVVIGYFITSVELKLNPILKGIMISCLAFLPLAIIIGWNDTNRLMPITVMTIILGGFIGYGIGKIK